MPETERVIFTNSKKQKIYGYLDTDPSFELNEPPAILICHGMLSNKDSNKHKQFSEKLAERGFLVLRFDFSFVGESEGTLGEMTFTGEVEDLQSAVAYIRTRTDGPLGLIGSSMGSAIAALYAAQDPQVKAMVLMASLARPGEYDLQTEKIYREQGFIDTPLGDIGLQLLDDAKKQNVLEAITKSKASVLLIHGQEDELIPPKEAMDLFQAAGGEKSIYILGGADHRFSEERHVNECASLIANWFSQYLEFLKKPGED